MHKSYIKCWLNNLNLSTIFIKIVIDAFLEIQTVIYQEDGVNFGVNRLFFNSITK